MNDSPNTVAAQRADLLRQVVFNRAESVPADQRRWFSAEIGLTVHAFMADFYAAALAEVDPERAEQVARELAEYLEDGALPEYSWDRAVELGHDPRVWVAEWDKAQAAMVEKPAQTCHDTDGG
ncbi:hypothetical protein [Kitasatospora sp. NBC_01302]|uniref:hypothetical protein n=1 Tax=Kitasatospora sp. NBC_01302 TaxID=2903575 RepID=UPI002E11E38E|nr:hypothetical protein OG294_27785 [Kitasatospora sp. NBC_01302]